MTALQKLTTPRRVWPLWLGLIIFWGSYYFRAKNYLSASSFYYEANANSTSDGLLLIAALFTWFAGMPVWLVIAGFSFENYQGKQPLFEKIKLQSFWAHCINSLCILAFILSLLFFFTAITHLYEVVTTPEIRDFSLHATIDLIASAFWCYLWLCIRVMTVTRIKLHNESKEMRRSAQT